MSAEKNCKKVGPYLPVGETDWTCLTHGVFLYRTEGEGEPVRRSEMRCPAGDDGARRAEVSA